MSDKRNEVTAAELLARLESDPQYITMRQIEDEKAKQLAELHAKAEQPIVAELQKHGHQVDSLAQLVTQPLPAPSAQVLLDWIPRIESPRLLEEIVRGLALSVEPFDATPLTVLFDQTDEAALRWAIADTLTARTATRVGSWILERVRDRSLGRSREMLVVALAVHVKADQAIPALVEVFDEMPGHVAMALSVCGTTDELSLLESSTARLKKWEQREVSRAIRAIQKRNRKSIDRG